MKKFDEFFNKPINENVETKVLRTMLWDKGWKQYWAAQDKLSKMLRRYQSVSDLPEGTDEKTLEELSNKLIALTSEINKIIDEKH